MQRFNEDNSSQYDPSSASMRRSNKLFSGKLRYAAGEVNSKYSNSTRNSNLLSRPLSGIPSSSQKLTKDNLSRISLSRGNLYEHGANSS